MAEYDVAKYLPLHKYFYNNFKQFKKIEAHNYIFYSFSPTIEDLRLVNFIAINKSKKTNDADQNGKSRTLETKIRRQFMGDLAELAVTKFLVNIENFEPDQVKWWDVERPTFKYDPKSEFDVAIVGQNNSWIDVNVRASFYKEVRKIGDMFISNKMDYIPRYTNNVKREENEGNLSLRVIYSFPVKLKRKLDSRGWKARNEFYDNLDIFKYLTTNNEKEFLRLYIVGFAPTALIEKKKKEKSLSQSNTKYDTLKLGEGMPIEKLSDWINDHLK